MKSFIKSSKSLLLLACTLPFTAGCLGGGAGLIGGLLAGGAGAAGSLGAGAGSGLLGGGGGELAVVTQPEPTTLILFGSGVVAMRFLNKKKK